MSWLHYANRNGTQQSQAVSRLAEVLQLRQFIHLGLNRFPGCLNTETLSICSSHPGFAPLLAYPYPQSQQCLDH